MFSIDDIANEATSLLLAAAVAIVLRRVPLTLRAVATLIGFLADILEAAKKEKGLMLSGDGSTH